MQYAKALAAAVVAGLTSLYSALGDNAVSTAEWVAAAIAFVVALGTVWAIPNADPGREP